MWLLTANPPCPLAAQPCMCYSLPASPRACKAPRVWKTASLVQVELLAFHVEAAQRGPHMLPEMRTHPEHAAQSISRHAAQSEGQSKKGKSMHVHRCEFII